MIANTLDDASRFRRSKNAEEKAAWLQETTPQNTRNSTKWSVKIFEEWQSARSNKVATSKSLGFDYVRVDEVQDLTVDIAQMSPLSLNFWITKFVGEIGNRSVLILYKSDETQASLSLCTQCCYKCGF